MRHPRGETGESATHGPMRARPVDSGSDIEWELNRRPANQNTKLARGSKPSSVCAVVSNKARRLIPLPCFS
jgi:hypothetical protein